MQSLRESVGLLWGVLLLGGGELLGVGRGAVGSGGKYNLIDCIVLNGGR